MHATVKGPTMIVPKKMIEILKAVQKVQDADTLATAHRAKCLTPEVSKAVLDRYKVKEELALGGMSRLFLDETRAKVVKVTDVSKSWGKHERLGYELLWDHGLPTCRVFANDDQGEYDVLVLERLLCTATTVLLVSTTDSTFHPCFNRIVDGIDRLLTSLASQRLAIVDFSTNNLMCRLHGDDALELVIVDPQFAVPVVELSKAVGTVFAENIDRLHLCMKFLASWNNDRYTSALCKKLIGFEPTVEDTIRILVYKLPIVLRAAYTIMKRLQSEKKNPG